MPKLRRVSMNGDHTVTIQVQLHIEAHCIFPTAEVPGLSNHVGSQALKYYGYR